MKRVGRGVAGVDFRGGDFCFLGADSGAGAPCMAHMFAYGQIDFQVEITKFECRCALDTEVYNMRRVFDPVFMFEHP